MPWELMNNEQLEQFLEEKPRLEEMPGVLYVQPEYVGGRRREAAVVVYLRPGHRDTLRQLPPTLAGLPVVAMIEDPKTGTVQEVIDLRTSEDG